jgi:hypothetical protein
MAAPTDTRRQLEIARPAASARDERVPPEACFVQAKKCVYRARDPPVGDRVDTLMPNVVGQAIADYYILAKE